MLFPFISLQLGDEMFVTAIDIVKDEEYLATTLKLWLREFEFPVAALVFVTLSIPEWVTNVLNRLL